MSERSLSEAVCANSFLELWGLGVMANATLLMKHLHRRGSRVSVQITAYLKKWEKGGLIAGNQVKGYGITKQGQTGMKKIAGIEAWIEEAVVLMDALDVATILPDIDWLGELKNHPDYFKAARYPFLKDDRFYLRGRNHKKQLKPHAPPVDGWLDNEVPLDRKDI